MSESIRTYQKLLHEYIDTLAARDRQIKHLLEDSEGLREALRGAVEDLKAVVKFGDDKAMAESIRSTLPRYEDALSGGRDGKLRDAANDVLAERSRQKSAEGWTTEHDDTHDKGEMAFAAAAYATVAATDSSIGTGAGLWPWGWDWWKPSSHRENLVRAGALILAEIERLDRAALSSGRDGRKT